MWKTGALHTAGITGGRYLKTSGSYPSPSFPSLITVVLIAGSVKFIGIALALGKAQGTGQFFKLSIKVERQKERLVVMAAKAKKTQVVTETPLGERYDELKRMLVERQREIMAEVQGKIRDVRAEGADKDHEVLDPGETSEVDIQEDIEFALIQMKAETLNKINEALARLEEGTYGNCFECGDEIAQPRLRALPFAVRCKDCEEAREMAQQRERIQARRGSATLGFDMRG
jgi:DnaK suppressor protein